MNKEIKGRDNRGWFISELYMLTCGHVFQTRTHTHTIFTHTTLSHTHIPHMYIPHTITHTPHSHYQRMHDTYTLIHTHYHTTHT